MRAEVVSVGTELLLGDIVNTNAAHIGQALASIGVDCFMHTSVGDNEQRIADAIAAALAHADAVIVTGGLGPTQDDVTRRAQPPSHDDGRSEEHTSELQSRRDLVCRLLLEKKKMTLDSSYPGVEQDGVVIVSMVSTGDAYVRLRCSEAAAVIISVQPP